MDDVAGRVVGVVRTVLCPLQAAKYTIHKMIKNELTQSTSEAGSYTLANVFFLL